MAACIRVDCLCFMFPMFPSKRGSPSALGLHHKSLSANDKVTSIPSSNSTYDDLGEKKYNTYNCPWSINAEVEDGIG